ncbi:hypothetical protein QFC21_002215 [Naganishia friedmannii]|uniref:Uncharacterized protein n=1 Tax=Naganishia friedmannii TaxID=89922 RepID=A0ACC2VXZ9_9TREE|nr:hypothetical protein QFC21_002215 [Naganishia friedmannii]
MPNGTRRGTSKARERWKGFVQLWKLERATDEIDSEELVIPLIIVSFVTGALDSTCYADLATFASNQTGNIIMLSVGAAGLAPPGHNTLFNGISLVGYLVSAFLASSLANYFGTRLRFWIMLSHSMQVVLLLVGLILLATKVIVPRHVVLLVMLASASGVQVAQARTSKVPEVPTAMLSTPIVDLIVDPNLFKLSMSDPSVQPRNRRAAHIFSMVIGSFVGAFMHKASGTVSVMAMSIGIKVMVTCGFWMIRSPKEKEAMKQRRAG